MGVYVEAPGLYTGELPVLFLAGGISGCPDWQAEARELLEHLPIAIANPRRVNFPIGDRFAAAAQINWEYQFLARASVQLFWFPASGPVPQPIALFELGAASATDERIAVGCDLGYVRRDDVVHQLHLRRPDVSVRDNLRATCVVAERLMRGVLLARQRTDA